MCCIRSTYCVKNKPKLVFILSGLCWIIVSVGRVRRAVIRLIYSKRAWLESKCVWVSECVFPSSGGWISDTPISTLLCIVCSLTIFLDQQGIFEYLKIKGLGQWFQSLIWFHLLREGTIRIPFFFRLENRLKVQTEAPFDSFVPSRMTRPFCHFFPCISICVGYQQGPDTVSLKIHIPDATSKAVLFWNRFQSKFFSEF